MSGKRNNLEDLGIVELESSRPLRSNDRQLDPAARLSPAHSQDVLHSEQDQLLGGAAFAGGTALQPAVNRVRDIHRCPHLSILPYLWPARNLNRMCRRGKVKTVPPFAKGHAKDPAPSRSKAGPIQANYRMSCPGGIIAGAERLAKANTSLKGCATRALPGRS